MIRPIDLWKEEHGKTPCAGLHTIFFPEDHQPGYSAKRERLAFEARNICSTCPALIPCAQSSTLTIGSERYTEPGIWAGRDQAERCKITGHPPVPGTGTKYSHALAATTRRKNANTRH